MRVALSLSVLALCGLSTIQASLVGHWSADGNALDDLGNDGSVVGSVAYGAGKVGQAFVFDGGSGRIEVADSAAYAFGTGDFSIAYWVNFTSIGFASTGMISKDTYAGGGSYEGWLLNHDGSVGLLTRNEPGVSTSARTSPGDFALGQWYHFGAVRQSGVLRLYVDGNLKASATEASATDLTNDALLRFGSLSPASLQSMNGSLDEIRLYDSALTESEVQALAAVPEPMSVLALALGLAATRRRRR